MVKKKKEDQIDKKEKLIKYIVIAMLSAFVIAIVIILIINYTADFEYKGFEFERYRQGGDLYYVTYIKTPIKDFALALINHPKNLEYISVDANIILFTNKKLYVVKDHEMPLCELDGVSLVQFGRFLGALGMDPKSGALNETIAEESGIAYKTCETTEKNEISIFILAGNETKITQENNCYNIYVEGCDINKGIEKFMLEVITQAPDKPQ